MSGALSPLLQPAVVAPDLARLLGQDAHGCIRGCWRLVLLAGLADARVPTSLHVPSLPSNRTCPTSSASRWSTWPD